MGIRILEGDLGDTRYAVMIGSDWAFGPLFSPMEGGLSAGGVARAFIAWLPLDPREYEDHALESRYNQFMDKNSGGSKNDDER